VSRALDCVTQCLHLVPWSERLDSDIHHVFRGVPAYPRCHARSRRSPQLRATQVCLRVDMMCEGCASAVKRILGKTEGACVPRRAWCAYQSASVAVLTCAVCVGRRGELRGVRGEQEGDGPWNRLARAAGGEAQQDGQGHGAVERLVHGADAKRTEVVERQCERADARANSVAPGLAPLGSALLSRYQLIRVSRTRYSSASLQALVSSDSVNFHACASEGALSQRHAAYTRATHPVRPTRPALRRVA